MLGANTIKYFIIHAYYRVPFATQGFPITFMGKNLQCTYPKHTPSTKNEEIYSDAVSLF